MESDEPSAGRSLTRRQVLARLGASGAALLTGGVSRGEAQVRAPALACVARPQQIEGPYFIDEKLQRSDIRSDPATGSVSAGVPLRLAFRVSGLSGASCIPLTAARVDVWQCDAEGLYSDTGDFQASTIGLKYLRGYQLTDKQGAASFVTIFPGWYPGRTVHIHFKIRIGSPGRGGKEFTSQIYFDDALTDLVHAQLPYSLRPPRKVRNNRDMISLLGGSDLILPLRAEKKGYAGTFDIALDLG